MILDPLSEPRYVQTEVLAVTRLRPTTLQTWLNRGVVRLAEQNPGYGRRRRYSAIDVVKLAVMRRIGDLRIDLSRGVALAEICAEELLAGRDVPWSQHLTIRPDTETVKVSPNYSIISSNHSPFAGYEPTQIDAHCMRVADFTEPFEMIASRRERPGLDAMLAEDEGRPVNPARRESLARRGIHAEPVIIFPIGEVVNGTLAQLRALDEQDPR